MGWIWAALLPHPPIIIPEVGCGRQESAEATIRGMKTVVNRLSGKNGKPSLLPERILLLSPHQPYVPNALFANMASSMSGSFKRFNADNVQLGFANDPKIFESLVSFIDRHVPLGKGTLADMTVDHGSLVPLYFFEKAWGRLPEIYCLNPSGLTLQQSQKLGEVLARYEDGASWGFIASGDLSHRLTSDAPGGYNPAGKIFDKAVLAALMEGTSRPIMQVPAKILQDAGECGCRPVLALLGLVNGPVEIISYEGPFGVGYCTALVIVDEGQITKAPMEKEPEQGIFPLLARMAIETYLENNEPDSGMIMQMLQDCPKSDRQLLESPGACFVTIKSANGELRGCIGTILPVRDTLLEEIIGNAIAAASRDPRFPPLKAEEFDGIRLSVDLLGKPEPVGNQDMLDPVKYGVIVSKENKRGLLLPDLEGVDTVEKQVSIASAKAGITDLEGASVLRFTVDRFHEM